MTIPVDVQDALMICTHFAARGATCEQSAVDKVKAFASKHWPGKMMPQDAGELAMLVYSLARPRTEVPRG